jgi:peptidoglycan hydrolase CwlO-like protein|tara:strand:+ start:751 stop:990 length:240 start_codon:yes stop_codon:yes gene_type:complete
MKFEEFLLRGFRIDALPTSSKTSVYDLSDTDLTYFKQQQTQREIDALYNLIDEHTSSIHQLEKTIATLEKDLDKQTPVY